MAELQTLAAVYELGLLAVKVYDFLKTIKHADESLARVLARVEDLKQVQDSLRGVLEARKDRESIGPAQNDDHNTKARIERCVNACKGILTAIEKRAFVQSPDVDRSTRANVNSPAIIKRILVAFRQPNTLKLLDALETRVGTLQMELVLLQLSDHAYTHAIIKANRNEMLDYIRALAEQLDKSINLLENMSSVQRQSSNPNDAGRIVDKGKQDAIDSLREEIRIAGIIHERYTSEYLPDDHSIRYHQRVESELDPLSSVGVMTPASSLRSLSPNSSHYASADENFPKTSARDGIASRRGVAETAQMQTMHIKRHLDEFAKEQSGTQINKAEKHLRRAIQYSETRERQHKVPFANRHQLLESLAILSNKQRRYAEAFSILNSLMEEDSDDLSNARQSRLVAETFYDRHKHEDQSMMNEMSDLENAKTFGITAFNILDNIMEHAGQSNVVDDEYRACVAIVVRVCEELGDKIEADNYNSKLSDQALEPSDLQSRKSTVSSPSMAGSEFVHVCPQDDLIQAIKNGDMDQIRMLSLDDRINYDRPSRGKTLLMHAIERDDDGILRTLLRTETRADVNAVGSKGVTALHYACRLGKHKMVQCLLDHDAEIEKIDETGDTPLLTAAKHGQRIVLELLHGRRADFLAQNKEGWSCLHWAVSQPDTRTITQLLDIAPDLRQAADSAGKTALHHCVEKERFDQAKALLQHKNAPDINAADSHNRTPLFLATQKPATPKREAIVQLLIDYGVKLDLKGLSQRHREYAVLGPVLSLRRQTSRQNSVSTIGTSGTISTSRSRLSRIFSSHQRP